jgi:hypothetical protein
MYFILSWLCFCSTFKKSTCTLCEYEKAQKPDSCNHWRLFHCRHGAMYLPQQSTVTVKSTVSLCAVREIYTHAS